MKPRGPQSIRQPVLDKNSKERFSKEQPRPDEVSLTIENACSCQLENTARVTELSF